MTRKCEKNQCKKQLAASLFSRLSLCSEVGNALPFYSSGLRYMARLRSGRINSRGLCGKARSDTAGKAAPGLIRDGHKSTAENGVIIVLEQQNIERVSVGRNTSFHQEQRENVSLKSLLFHPRSCALSQQVSKLAF